MNFLRLEANNKFIQLLIYSVLFVLVIVDRYFILEKFAWVYTDSDQSIMWAGLSDYSNGIFKEPRFYGQNYNTFLEAFLAVPLFERGIRPNVALPLITSFLALLPFVILSLFTLLKKSNLVMSLLILAMPLMLPVSYGMLTSMPRGFVTGIAIAGLAGVGAFYIRSNWWYFTMFFLVILAYSVNSNSVVLSIPLLLIVFLENKYNRNFYLYSFLGLLLGASLHASVQYFYKVHPFYNLHPLWMDYSLKALLKSLEHMDYFLNYNMPIMWSSGSLILLVFLLIAYVFWKQGNRNKSYAFMSVPFLILFTLGFEKVHQGTHSIFFHYSRMFLAIPILLSLGLSFIHIKNKLVLVIGVLSMSGYFFISHIPALEVAIESNEAYDKLNPVVSLKTSRLENDCSNLNTICKRHKIELVVFSQHFFEEPYAYGCGCINSEFPKTLRPVYERRTWRMLEDDTTIYKTLLLFDLNRDFSKEFLGIKNIEKNLYLIESNTLTTFNLLDSLKIPYRKFKEE